MNNENRKTAVITGASSGLGLEFSRLCAKDGYNLVLVARNESKLYQLKKEFENTYGVDVYVCALDLSKVDATLDVYDYTLEHQLNAEVLINNAGFGDAGKFYQRDWQRQYEMVQLNITALIQLTHCYLKTMVKEGNGKILNLSSVASFSAGPGMSIYYASKEFVRSFSEAMAEEVKGTGVTVTGFCPGPTATGFEKNADMGNHSSMFKRAATAQDVAKAGYQAMQKGKVLYYHGVYTKCMNIGARLVPRSWSRKYASTMNRIS